MSNRRQPVRQTRTNTARNVTNVRTLGGTYGAQPEPPKPDIAPGFFPGLMHFTDSITALPKEMVRHYTMLKEVDAKICHPEDALRNLVSEALKGPPPAPTPPAANNTQNSNKDDEEAVANVPDQHSLNHLFDRSHRELHMQLRFVANSMLVTLDEKNHVLGNATDQLEKLIARCESSWPAIENEISEVTRVGNLDHWAYSSNSATDKKGSASESRPRREAATNNLTALANTADLEGKYDGRTVVASRKHRLAQNDSDFDEPRAGKRAATGKGKKPEYNSGPVTGLGITNGTSGKKRKVEKSVAGIGGHPMDRSTSSLYGNSRTGGSPRDTPSLETAKKRNRNTGTALSAAVQGRKRAGTANSTTNSPNLASSPVAGSFTSAPKVANSPALGAALMQRTGSTRARQNSTNTSQPSKPPSTIVKETLATTNGSSLETSSTFKGADVKIGKNDDLIPGESNARAGARSTDRTALKKEDSVNSRQRPPAITTSARNNGKASKTATPVAASFPESSRPRSGRNNAPAPISDQPPKRSHKKGAGINAQAAAAAAKAAAEAARAAAEDENSELGDDDEAADGEPLYCYCQKVSYGEMIGCDYPKCKREWFHLACVGLEKAPGKNETWYCKDCAPLVAKRR